MNLYDLLYGAPSPGWDEEAFRKWYSDQAKKTGISPDPDDPRHFYDFRAAFRAGAVPNESGHWTSQFKLPGHPNLNVGGVDTRTGRPEIPPSGSRWGLGTISAPQTSGTSLGPEISALRGSQTATSDVPPTFLRDVVLQSLVDIGKNTYGGLEAALQMGSQVAALPGAGLVGLGAALDPAISGTGPVDYGVGTQAIGNVMRSSTFEPRTAAGQAAAQTASYPFQKLGEAGEGAGTTVQEAVTPYLGKEAGEILGATTASMIEAAPLIAGEIGLRTMEFATGLGEAGSLNTLPAWKVKYIQKAREFGISEKEIQARFRAIDQVKAINEKYKYLLPEEDVVSPLRGNDFDILTADFDASCPRRDSYGPTIAEVERRAGRTLNSQERFDVGMSMRKHGHTAPCAYCMIETGRSAQADIVPQFAEQLNIPPRALVDEEFLAHLKKTDPDIETRIDTLHKKVQGGVKANKPKVYAPYRDHLFRQRPETRERLNNLRGLRLNSATDMKPEFILDKIQMIHDGNLTGSLMYEYTKIPENVEIFGNTGIKMNMSIAAKGGKGRPVLEDAVEGMPWKDAKRLQKEYPDAGVALLAINHDQILFGLNSPWIGEIIPNHRSGMPKELREFLGFDDFTGSQSEKWVNPDAHKYQDPKTGKIKTEKVPTIGPKQHGNSKARYLAYCKENNIVPKFPEYVNHPNYMKLIVDHSKPAKGRAMHRPPDPRKINYKKAAKWVDKWGESGGTKTAPLMDVVDDVLSRIPHEVVNKSSSRLVDGYFDGIEKISPPEGIVAAEEAWAGGVADLGDPDAGYIIQQMPDYFDYRSKLESVARGTLGDEFTVYRAMTPEQFDAWKNGEDIGPIGVTTERDVAESWHKVAKNQGKEFIVVEMDAPAESIVMRGKPEESEIVIDGNAISFHTLRILGRKRKTR